MECVETLPISTIVKFDIFVLNNAIWKTIKLATIISIILFT
jgi:hypothetical protein